MSHEKLKAAMKQKGVTVYQLAKETQIKPPGLYQAINGRIPFWPGWRKRVADALNMSETELFEQGSNNE